MKTVKIAVDRDLLDRVKQKLPEVEGLTHTSLVDYIIRKLLKEIEKNETKTKNKQKIKVGG